MLIAFLMVNDRAINKTLWLNNDYSSVDSNGRRNAYTSMSGASRKRTNVTVGVSAVAADNVTTCADHVRKLMEFSWFRVDGGTNDYISLTECAAALDNNVTIIGRDLKRRAFNERRENDDGNAMSD